MSGCLRNQQTISNSELTQRLLLLRGETLVKQRSLSDFKMKTKSTLSRNTHEKIELTSFCCVGKLWSNNLKISDLKMVMVMMKNMFLAAMITTATGMLNLNKKSEHVKNLIHVFYFGRYGQNLNGYNLRNNGSNYWRRAKLILSCKSSFSWYPNVVRLPTDAFSSLQEISLSFFVPFCVGPIDTVLKLL